MLSVGLPKDDRCEGELEHDPANFRLLSRHPQHRGTDQLEREAHARAEWALYKAIVDGLAGRISLRREDVLINFVEVKIGKLVGGNGIDEYA
jgi:hypothetical protein